MRRLLCVLVVSFTLWAQSASAAVSLVGHVTVVGSGSSAGIVTSATPNFLIAVTVGVTPTSTPVDSLSNTWVTGTQITGAFGGGVTLFWVVNPTVGASGTQTFSNASSTGGMCVLAFSGVNTTSPFDAQSGTNGSGFTGRPGSITPAGNNEVFITAAGGGTSTTFSVGSGFTLVDSLPTVGGTNYSAAIAYKVQTTGGAENPLWTLSLSNEGINMAAFLSNGAGPPPSGPSPCSSLRLLGVGCELQP